MLCVAPRLIRMGICLSIAGLLAVGVNAQTHTRETTLTVATDLKADAIESTKRNQPIIILYSLPGCPHCEVVRRSHLTPMSNETPPRAIIRQLNLQSTAPLRDFAGVMTTHRDFINQQKIKFAPVVAFYNAAGQRLGDALIGTMLPDFYGAYLEEGLTEARKRLVQPVTPPKK